MEPVAVQVEKLYPTPALAEIGYKMPTCWVPEGVVKEFAPPPLVAKNYLVRNLRLYNTILGRLHIACENQQ